MKESKDYLKINQIRPRISFKESPRRQLVLLKDKREVVEIEGKKVDGVRYLVKENGEEKTFFTGSVSLIEKLSEYEEGSEVVIEMKSRKGEDGQWKSYFVVSSPLADSPNVEVSQEEPEEVNPF